MDQYLLNLGFQNKILTFSFLFFFFAKNLGLELTYIFFL